jgi:serine/threonine protein kinase
MTNPVVTLWYRAPELLLETPVYSYEIDMWSVGCVFAEMYLRKPILYGPTELVLLEKVFKLLGTPSDQVLLKLNRLPCWKKYDISSLYPSTLAVKLSE